MQMTVRMMNVSGDVDEIILSMSVPDGLEG